MQLTQPEIDSLHGTVYRDCPRPLAKYYQGGGFRLHVLSIPPGRLEALVTLLLIDQFGPYNHLNTHFSDLDRVSSCIVKAFHQDPHVDITWPMFDDAPKGMVCFLAIYNTMRTMITALSFQIFLSYLVKLHDHSTRI